ncbi:MAG: hypothetical protein F6K28_16280 [Microcoleus sp. SIO2G3]|nr:hypothetical protein [Microcoleus sp. SIO2G3]
MTVQLKFQRLHECYHTTDTLIYGIFSMNKAELLVYIQRIIDSKYAGLQVAFAQDHELSAAYVNDVLKSRREPGKKILDAVEVERITVYKPKADNSHQG